MEKEIPRAEIPQEFGATPQVNENRGKARNSKDNKKRYWRNRKKKGNLNLNRKTENKHGSQK
ncbi:MAG: hypothetical protein K2H76_08300 [Muribaculaceae bacterium]|nr:hypothetical protein [Muribaculaceae bacterium]